MGESSKVKTLIISAVNFIDGGPLSILKDCLNNLLIWNNGQYKIIALVHSTSLFREFEGSEIIFNEYPNIKKSWIKRLVFEYSTCKNISLEFNCDVWFSLHDISPNVTAKKRIVYCHNPAPFYKISLREAWMEKKFFAFNILYKFLYRINIKKNDYVIVQQNWIRNYFIHRYHVKNVIVAYPNIEEKIYSSTPSQNKIVRFIYPALPRVFKNFEVLFEATKMLSEINNAFEVCVTFNGSENEYAKYIYQKFKEVNQIKFIGRQSREMVYELYKESDCLVFPSKLETWGLPITEMKMFQKPLLIADYNYAHETVGQYNKVCFFNGEDSLQLKELMLRLINGTLSYEKKSTNLPNQPFTQSWLQMFDITLK